MATTRFILGIICLAGTIGNWLFDSHSLEKAFEGSLSVKGVRVYDARLGIGRAVEQEGKLIINPTNFLTVEARRRLVVEITKTQLNVKEIGGNNYGKEVKAYLAYTKLKEGNPWCAAFVSWVYGKIGYSEPCTAWSPALFPKDRIVKTPKPADVFGIYFPQLKRIAHCGLIEMTRNDWIITIEGNTNLNGSNDGDGVYRKWRHRKTISVYSDWLKKKGGGND